MILAKPVVADQFWILRDEHRKIGEINKKEDGYFYVKINNEVSRFINKKEMAKKIAMQWINPPLVTKKKTQDLSIGGYETDCLPYNPTLDIQHQIPIYTKSLRSKSWFAAGWYKIRQNARWRWQFCPKLITLQRYEFQGPLARPEDSE